MDFCTRQFSSPFLGTFFQLPELAKVTAGKPVKFSSPFLGTFFQFGGKFR